jgi:hypothetical protein
VAKLQFVDISNDCPVVGCRKKKGKGGLCRWHMSDLRAGKELKHYLGGSIVKKEVSHG